MDRERAEQVLAMFEKRGDVEAMASAGPSAAHSCLDRATDRLAASELLLDAEHWESAFTNSYDAFRMAAESVVLAFGYRVPAVAGAHRPNVFVPGGTRPSTSIPTGRWKRPRPTRAGQLRRRRVRWRPLGQRLASGLARSAGDRDEGAARHGVVE